jgi:hypothetical protein
VRVLSIDEDDGKRGGEPMSDPRSLRQRARRLRSDAASVLTPLAAALRRRAAELEFEAFLIEQSRLPAA